MISGTGIDSIHKKYSKHETYKIDGNLKVREMKDMFNKFNMTIEEAEIEEKKILHFSLYVILYLAQENLIFVYLIL